MTQEQGRSASVRQAFSVRWPLMTRPQVRPVQQTWDGEQDSSSFEQVGGPRQVHFVGSEEVHAARVAVSWQVTPSPFGQHGFVVEQAWSFAGQVCGISQLQIWPAVHAAVCVVPSTV